MATYAGVDPPDAVLHLETPFRRTTSGSDEAAEPRTIEASLMLAGEQVRHWSLPLDAIILPPRMRSFRLLTHRASEWLEETEASSPTAALWHAATLLGSYQAADNAGTVQNLLQVAAEFAALLLAKLANSAEAPPYKLQQAALHCAEIQQVAGRVGLGVLHTEQFHLANSRLDDVKRRASEQAVSALDQLDGSKLLEHASLKRLGDLRSGARNRVTYASLPSDFVSELRREVDRATEKTASQKDLRKAPLWLEFGRADIHLPTLPWEELLAPLGVPVRRLPYLSMASYRLRQPTHVLVCCTTPFSMMGPSAQRISEMIDRIVDGLHEQCRVTIVCDRQYVSQLERHVGKGRSARRAAVVTLDQSELQRAAERSHVSLGRDRGPAHRKSKQDAQPISPPDPWCTLLAEVLHDDAADVLHLFAPGHLGPTGPVAVFSASPAVDAKKHEASVRSPSELADLVAASGASAVVCSAFGDEASQLAWRYLCDELARCVPGTIAFHDAQAARAERALDELYGFLFFGPHHAPPGDLPVYCHPSAQRVLLSGDDSAGSFERAPDMRIPLWLAQASRKLETLFSDAFAVQTDGAAQRDTFEALKDAEHLLRSIIQHGKLEPAQVHEYLARGKPTGTSSASGVP